MRIPNLNTLRMFDAAARHLNFGRAADELHLTQGAVAQRVRKLEADLDIALFYRRPRGLELTPAGRDYHSDIHAALRKIDSATAALRQRDVQIKISVTPSFASKWLVPRLPDLMAHLPGMDVQIDASETLANFTNDDVSIAIRQGKPPFGAGLTTRLLAQLNLCAVCSPSYAQTLEPTTLIEDFVARPLIQDSHTYWTRMLDSTGTRPAGRVMQFNQTAHAIDAAANGQGIALAPALLVQGDLAQNRLVALWHDEGSDQAGYYICVPETLQRRADILAVVDWLVGQAR